MHIIIHTVEKATIGEGNFGLNSRARNKGVSSDKNQPSWSFVRTKACMVSHAAVELSELNH